MNVASVVCISEYAAPKERRRSRRYPLELPAEVRVGDRVIQSRTINVCARGVLIACDQDLEAGTDVSVRMSWPTETSHVVLNVRGVVVRAERGKVGVRFSRHTLDRLASA